MVFRCIYVVEIVDESMDRSTAGYILLLIRGIENCKKADRDLGGTMTIAKVRIDK